jgi:hypothetical protein
MSVGLALQPKFPSEKHREMLKGFAASGKNEKANALDLTALNYEQRQQWHAYDYGWRRRYLNDYGNSSPIDRQGLYFVDRLAQQAHVFWNRQDIREKCAATYENCQDRWMKRGVVCFQECKYFPSYREMSIEEVDDLRRKNGLDTRVRLQRKYEIAAAYRMRHAQGRTLPAGLPENHPDVLDAVRELRASHARQDRERAAAADLSDQEYAALCMRQVRENVELFAARNRIDRDERRRVQEALGLKASEAT